jgi:hypothetical protein
MNTQTHNIQRLVASAIALVILSGGLHLAVTQTLGYFDAATVILALYLGFWAFVLGTTGLVFSSIWLAIFAEPMTGKREVYEHAPVQLRSLRHRRLCMTH